jgi:hypothetical protein
MFMEEQMTIEQLRGLHQAQPFRPFTMHLADGRSIRVPHQEVLSHSPGGRTVIVFHADESFTIIDLLLVTSIDGGAPVGESRQGNGQ